VSHDRVGEVICVFWGDEHGVDGCGTP
jgi:hypothetical protein